MATFRYQAQTVEGKIVSSTIEALNFNTAIDTLTASKLRIVLIKPVRFSVLAWLRHLRRVDRQNVVLMTRRLGIMLRSGLVLARSLEVLQAQETDSGLKAVLMSVLHDVRSGSSLSWAASKHPETFDPVYISMIRVGEMTGDMALMFDRLANFQERDLAVRKQAKAALTYPAFVFTACVLVVAAIFIFVLPQMLAVFAGTSHFSLPLPTRVMILLCEVVRNPYVQLGSVLSMWYYAAALRSYVRTPEGKLAWDRLKIRLPLVGPITRKLLLGHFCRGLGTLLATGVPFLKSLEVVMEFIDNEYFKQTSCALLYEQIREGKTVGQVIQDLDFFPPLARNMIVVGETIGELPGMLERISRFLDAEIQYTLEAFLAMIEPIMIGTLGAIVCFILLSVFLPIYQFIMSMD